MDEVTIAGYKMPWWIIPISLGIVFGLFFLARRGTGGTTTVTPAYGGEGLPPTAGSQGGASSTDLSALAGALEGQTNALQASLSALQAQEQQSQASNLTAIQGLNGAFTNLANQLAGVIGGGSTITAQPGGNGLGPPVYDMPRTATSGGQTVALPSGSPYTYYGTDVVNNALKLKNTATGIVESFDPTNHPAYSVYGGAQQAASAGWH